MIKSTALWEANATVVDLSLDNLVKEIQISSNLIEEVETTRLDNLSVPFTSHILTKHY